jgi:periplasmic divalent cation tolerance protein
VSGAYQVTTMASSHDEAERLATAMVERRLAACAQVTGPVTSTYWWRGAVERAEEWCCVFKTAPSALDELMAAVRSAHSYEVPEIVATAIDAGDVDYLAWIEEESGTRPAG